MVPGLLSAATAASSESTGCCRPLDVTIFFAKGLHSTGHNPYCVCKILEGKSKAFKKTLEAIAKGNIKNQVVIDGKNQVGILHFRLKGDHVADDDEEVLSDAAAEPAAEEEEEEEEE